MDNGRIYKVLIIEPSAIVGAGIRTLLDGFSEFRALDAETTGDPATCFERVATTGTRPGADQSRAVSRDAPHSDTKRLSDVAGRSDYRSLSRSCGR